MRRPLPQLLVVAVILGWAGSVTVDRLTLAPPPRVVAPGFDGPATARWNVRAPAIPEAPPPAGVSGDWLSAVKRSIDAREYEATPNDEGLQAPNRAHGFRTYFEAAGVRVVDRSVTASPLLTLHLERAGREERLAAVRPGAVTASGARVEIRRDENLIEWYENSPRGLEQGFTFAARPAGDGPLVVELAVAGARARASGNGATFETKCGRPLTYTGLAAVDARGRALAAHLEAGDDHVRLAVDDAGATYPVTIDPLVGSNAETQEVGAQAGERFGISVAGAGDVNGDGFEDVLVGADQYDSGQTDEGAGFLYYGAANGIPAVPIAPSVFQSDQASGFMGYVAGAGDVNGDGYADILVGGYGYALSHGIVCLFLGGPSGIPSGTPATAAATFTSTKNDGSFGLYQAGAGDVNGDGYGDILIGAKDYVVTGTGAAFIWLGSASGIASGNTSTASTQLLCTQATARFGASVAGIGDVNGDGFDDIAVGAIQYDAPENSEGAVFLWYGSPSGIASGTHASANRIIDSNVTGAQLGFTVAGAGDVNGDGYADLIAGALGYSNGSFTDEGAAFVFHGGPSGITATSVAGAAALLHTGQPSAFLSSVAGGDVNGDGFSDVIIGSGPFDNGATNTGAAFVFLGSASGILTGASGSPLDAYASLHLPATQASAAYGQRVATADVNGDGYADVIVGAPVWDGALTDEGTAFIYHGSPRGLVFGPTNFANAALPGNQNGQPLYGYSVASAGDVNGDGFSDVLIGAPRYDAGQTDEGAAFLFPGSASGVVGRLPNEAATMLQSDEAGAGLGWSVAGAGDVNGDGYSDVIVGAPFSNIDGTRSGFACVFLGGASGVASGTPATAATTLRSLSPGAEIGFSVAGAGDVNADGYADVIAGAPFWNTGALSLGAVWIFQGGPAGIPNGDPSTASTGLLSTVQMSTEFGISVASAGDVNGDGYSDVIVGADFYDVNQTDDGAAFLYHGGPNGIPNGGPSTATSVLTAATASGVLGSCVGSAGDVNADGYSDVIVGAPKSNSNNGGAWVFLGTSAGIPSGTTATATFAFPGIGGTGTSVAGIGDTDGDGYADVAVGAPNAAGQGSVTVRRGAATGISGNNGAVLSPIDLSVQFGFAVAGGGDVDGDGFADLVTTALTQTRVYGAEGESFVFQGNYGHGGRRTRARQFRGDGSGIEVQPGENVHATDRFHAGMTAADPRGRGREKIEIESCPNGVPFGSGSCTHVITPTWTDAGTSGAVALETDVPASPGIRHWRARAFHAALGVTKPGITAPPHPVHGPWRRFQARGLEADLRVNAVVLAVDRPGAWADFAIAPLANPARGRIALTATLPNSDAAEVALFDVAGRQVVSRAIGGSAGCQTLTLARAGELAPGVYLVRLTQGGRAATTRVVFVK